MAATPAGSVNPTTYTSATNAEGFTLGQKLEHLGGEYRFVKNAADGAITTGMAVVMASATAWTVTYSKGASQVGALASAGLCPVASVPANYYFWVLVSGLFAFAADSTNAVTNGSAVQGSNATNGQFINVPTNQSNVPIGQALANASGNVFAIMVTVG